MPDNRTSLADRAEELVQSLFGAAQSARKRSNVEILASVCRGRVVAKNHDFHIKSIAAEARQQGGPAEQTIRNAAGADYRAIIDAFARVVGGSTRQRSAANEYDNVLADRVAAHITDSQLRAEIGLLLAEHRSLKRQMDILRASTSKGLLIKIDTHGRETAADTTRLTDIQLESLRHFLSEANLKDNDWIIADDGRILTTNGREITRFGFVDAIRTLLVEH